MIYSTLIIYWYNLKNRGIPCRKNHPRLAQNLLSKMCAEIFSFLNKLLKSNEFISRHKTSDTHFTRIRKLPFHLVTVFLLSLVRGSYQDELDKFFKNIFRFNVAKRVVSKAAFTKARMKLRYQAFIELNLALVHLFQECFPVKTWNGFRLLAIDGSMARLPRINDISKHFGNWKVRQGRQSPMARISQLFDVQNKITIDAIISPKATGERELAASHIINLMPNDLVLLDRGYTAWWLYALILSMNANFCARVSYAKWKVINAFYQSNKKEQVLLIPPPTTSLKTAKELGLDLKPLKLRLVRVEDDGKVSILLTSLLDSEKFPAEIFAELYHKRWPTEEDYKTIKCTMEIENFSGQSVLSIYQDFYAKMLLKNMVSIMAIPVNDELIKAKDPDQKHDYQVNLKQAISKSKDVIVLLFEKPTSKVVKMIEQLHSIFIKTVEPIRPGRKNPRIFSVPSRKYFLNYKAVA